MAECVTAAPSRRKALRRSSCSALDDSSVFENSSPADVQLENPLGDVTRMRFEQSFSGAFDFNPIHSNDAGAHGVSEHSFTALQPNSYDTQPEAARRRQQRRSSWHTSSPAPIMERVPMATVSISTTSSSVLVNEATCPPHTNKTMLGTVSELNSSISLFQEATMPVQKVQKGKASRRSSWHAGTQVEYVPQEPPIVPVEDLNRHRTILMVKHVRTGATRRRSLTNLNDSVSDIEQPDDKNMGDSAQEVSSQPEMDDPQAKHKTVTTESSSSWQIKDQQYQQSDRSLPEATETLCSHLESEPQHRTFITPLRKESAPSSRRMNRRGSWGGSIMSDVSSISSDEDDEAEKKKSRTKKREKKCVKSWKRNARSHSPECDQIIVSTANMPLSDDDEAGDERSVSCLQLTAIGDVATCSFADF